jgi:hypothetical protein
MALNASPVSRNLHLKVTFLNLELEDLLAIMFAVAVSMLLGNLLFPDRYVFHIPLNYFIPLMILVAGVPGLMIFKYGKPRHYLVDLLTWHAKPRAYSAMGRERQISNPYLREDR